MLAGTRVADDDVVTLARLLRTTGFDDVAHRLDEAAVLGTTVLALSIVDRESILRALDDAPTRGLAELRSVLLTEHEWRVREGLV